MGSMDSSGSSNLAERRLIRSLAHVNQHWLPCNQNLLDRIQKGLSDGAYDLDVSFLLSDLKSDLGLYSFLVRELCRDFKSNRLPIPAGTTPAKLITLAGPEHLKRLLLVESRKISSHALKDSEDFQRDCLCEGALTASVTEALAETCLGDSDVGFSAGALKNLGQLLVAWNYPSVFKRAKDAVNDGTKLDSFLSEQLGFSPSLLASSLVADWGLSGAVADAVSTKGPQNTVLRELCDLGSSLAQAFHPDIHTSAAAEWDDTKKKIVTRLGADGFKLIQTKIRTNCSEYARLFPDTFAEPLKGSPESRLASYREEIQVQRNPYVKSCAPKVRLAFREAYAKMGRDTVSREAVEVIVKRVVPMAGFLGGVIYVLDPTTEQLMPRARFGDLALRHGEAVSCKKQDMDDDPVSTAFWCSYPLSDSSEIDSGNIGYITASLGANRKVGVLYLEFLDAMTSGFTTEMNLNFKAVRHALNDALKV